MRRFLVGAGLCVVTGCAGAVDPDDRVVRLVVQEAVATDSAVTVRLINESSRAVGYNLCYSWLQRQTTASWVGVEQGRTCLAIAYGLGPHSEVTVRRALPADLPAGHYRITTDVDWRHQPLPLTSNTFEVR
jgi:hypothetical protein